MSDKKHFYNISERYGDPEQVTLESYRYYNPEGVFEQTLLDEIRERFSDSPGDYEVVAVTAPDDRLPPQINAEY